MKNFFKIVVILFIIIAAVLFISSGFKMRTDVFLLDYTVSEDGSSLTIRTGLSGSMGYIRAVKTEQRSNAVHCSFYTAFGGLNSSIGAKNEFKIELNDSISEIYFDRWQEDDALVLCKDTLFNEWILP